MADRDLVHQPANSGGGLETGARPYDPPLLPYEIALIEALGCTEQEYRQFVRHAQLQARVRPAEYAHIPDVQNNVVSIVVSLVIGLALSAVSTLLAPKAPALESPAKIKGKKLADQIGPTRFNQTTSFDNVSSLAEYGQPIPIPFGKRGTGADGVLTGGLILAPALVWSRLYSYKSYQSFQAIYVTGEYGLTAPELGGIRLGTLPLDSLGNRDYALYWSSELGNNRPTSAKLIGGTQDTPDSGTGGGPIFTAPTEDGEFSEGFSMAYTPQGDTTFGTENPICNGTAYRFNWEIISAPYASTKGSDPDIKEARFETQARRRKIAGSKADVLHDPGPERGMPGVGRAYSRRMGFIKHSGTNGNAEIKERTIVPVKAGDTAVFEINYTNWKELEDKAPDDPDGGGFKGTEVDLKDLKAAADEWRERANDLLVVGSKWIIGASTWVVKSNKPVSVNGTSARHITFECVAILGVATLGIPGTRTVREPLGGYEGQEYNPKKHCGAAFFNVCGLKFASIRPVRQDAEVIEIGIKSQVWNKANGLCNFSTIPSPKKLNSLDKANISLTTGRIDKYFKRTSCFSLWVRPVQKYGEPKKPWARIGVVFCVTGTAPVNQYNYIRVRPKIKGYYEYRLIPRTGSDIAINSIDTNTVIRLDASNPSVLGEDFTSSFTGGAAAYGDFRITTNGEKVLVASIQLNDEMVTGPKKTEPISSVPTKQPTAVDQYAHGTNGSSNNLSLQSWYAHLLGYAWQKYNQWHSAEYQHYKPNGDKYITLKITAYSYQGNIGQTVGQEYVNASKLAVPGGSVHLWKNVFYQVVASTGDWNIGDAFTITLPVNNAFSQYIGYTQVGLSFKVTAVKQGTAVVDNVTVSAERIFEQASQVSDCSHFSELTKSNENGPEHEVVYVNECISNENLAEYYGMSTVGLVVKSGRSIAGVDQMRIWTPTGISVYRLIEKDFKPSNLYADLVYYLLTSKSQGLGSSVPVELIDVPSLEITANFLRNNKIFYDGVVEDSDSLRSFMYDTAPLQLCNFTVKNGRFGLMPALPYTSNYVISDKPIAIEQLFTAGNIIENSLRLEYIDAAQRAYMRAMVSWRVTVENDLPTQASALVSWADVQEAKQATQQTFDLTEFCTNREQALKTARFLLSIRRRVTHTVSFKTVPDALGIQPGSYIRVITSSTSYSAANNGAITDAGTLVSVSGIDNGTYDALVYNPATSSVLEQKITINNGAVTNSALHGTLFTLLSQTVNKGVYQVEQLTLDEDGLVNVAAIHVPVDADGASIVAKDVLTPSNFTVLE